MQNRCAEIKIRAAPLMDHSVEVLLALQKPDGRWEPVDPEDEYDRYHATWCVMDALRSYELGREGPEEGLIVGLLSRWARQLMLGEALEPAMDTMPFIDVP